jgi:pyridinium-3,5-biscarboxylic acid mononucleotide sulfurtransferase
VPYGTSVTPELLDRIDRAEAVLRELGFRQFRVRAHGELARIELAQDELARGLEPAVARQIAQGIKGTGFSLVSLDLEGYRQGSLNTLLKVK